MADLRRRKLTLQQTRASHQPLHRALNLIADDIRRVKLRRPKKGAQDRAKLIAVAGKNIGQGGYDFFRWIVVGEESPEFLADEAPRLRLGNNLRQHIRAVKV